MQEFSNEEIDALGLQIGCKVKVERLRRGLSQGDLGLMFGSNGTTVGRIERYENSTSWTNLLKVCQLLELDFHSLFLLQPLELVVAVIKECVSLEKKLTVQKELYYINLEIAAKEKFSKLKSR